MNWKQKEGMFAEQTIRESNANSVYASRIGRGAKLFSEEEPEEDDTKIDDLTLATELLTYENDEIKTWQPKVRQKENIFTDTAAEDEEARMEQLLESMDKATEEQKEVVQANQEESVIAASAVTELNQEVEDLLSKFSISSPTLTEGDSGSTEVGTGDLDISAYINANASTERKGLFD